MLDELLEYGEVIKGGHRPTRRKRQWMGFDDQDGFEAIKPNKHNQDEADEEAARREAKRELQRERRREKLAALEREF